MTQSRDIYSNLNVPTPITENLSTISNNLERQIPVENFEEESIELRIKEEESYIEVNEGNWVEVYDPEGSLVNEYPIEDGRFNYSILEDDNFILRVKGNNNSFSNYINCENSVCLELQTKICTMIDSTGINSQEPDGKLTLGDFSNFAREYSSECENLIRYDGCGSKDRDDSGLIDLNDFSFFARNYGEDKSCIVYND